ncbi:MAG: STAS domain-containing protein [Deltaproteobacteria bacterium]|nr:STAS domain-containing protein [Deltaproteobacteria bacterium]
MTLTITSKVKAAGIYLITPTGSLDSNTYSILEGRVDMILKDKPKMIAFDMQNLEYISSMGVRVIAKVQKELKKNQGQVTLLHLQPQIKKVFDIIKALPSDKIFASLAELDAYLDHMQKKVKEDLAG